MGWLLKNLGNTITAVAVHTVIYPVCCQCCLSLRNLEWSDDLKTVTWDGPDEKRQGMAVADIAARCDILKTGMKYCPHTILIIDEGMDEIDISATCRRHVVRHRHCRRFPKDTPKRATRMLTMSALTTTS